MPTGRGTAADAKLIHQLAKRNVPVTVRQLQERRRLGIIDPPEIVHHGRRGTQALDYPPGTVERIEQIEQMLSKHRDMDLVVLGLFGVGVNPRERALRDAYGGLFDDSEADDLRNLALANSGDPLFSEKLYDFASSMRKEIPEVVDRWNADSRARAREERQQVDPATGEVVHITSRDVRERDAQTWLLARIGDEGGDATPFLSAFGFRESLLAEMDEDGGTPTYAELRSALDAASYGELLRVRDLVRGSMSEFFAEALPESMAALLGPRLDTPDVVGLMVAAGVVSSLAWRERHRGEEGED